MGLPNNGTFGTQNFFHYTKVFLRNREISWYIKFFFITRRFLLKRSFIIRGSTVHRKQIIYMVHTLFLTDLQNLSSHKYIHPIIMNFYHFLCQIYHSNNCMHMHSSRVFIQCSLPLIMRLKLVLTRNKLVSYNPPKTPLIFAIYWKCVHMYKPLKSTLMG